MSIEASPMGMMDFGSLPIEVTSELENYIKPLIVGAIAGQKGVPYEAVCTAVLMNLPSHVKLPVDEAINSVTLILEKMTTSGELTRLTYFSENQRYTDYYPRDTSFTVEPARNLSNPPSRPKPPPLNIDKQAMATSFVRMFSEKDMNLIVLNLMAAFCPHCGRPEDGHVC